MFKMSVLFWEHLLSGCMNASRHLLPGGRGVQLLHLLNKPPAFLVLCYELGLEKIVLRCRTLNFSQLDAL